MNIRIAYYALRQILRFDTAWTRSGLSRPCGELPLSGHSGQSTTDRFTIDLIEQAAMGAG